MRANIAVDSFILVKFATKKIVKYYVGRVTEVLRDFNKFNLTFLRCHGSNFIYPNVPDTTTVSVEDIVLHLSEPAKLAGSTKIANLFSFSINLFMLIFVC